MLFFEVQAGIEKLSVNIFNTSDDGVINILTAERGKKIMLLKL